MADIAQELLKFEQAKYGEEVRGAMISAIEKINEEATGAAATVGDWLAQNGAPVIAEWLDGHPDATTTVMDDAVTFAKLAPEVVVKTEAQMRNTIASGGVVNITLGADVTISSPLVLKDGTVWINLNGHTLSKSAWAGPVIKPWPFDGDGTNTNYYIRASKNALRLFGGKIDLAETRGAVIECGLLCHSWLHDLEIVNAIDGMFAYTADYGSKSGSNVISTLRIVRATDDEYDSDSSTGTNAAIGLDLNMIDTTVTDVFTVFYPYGIWVRGNGNVVTRCHPWGMPRQSYVAGEGSGSTKTGETTPLPRSVVMRCGFICTAQNNKFVGCVSDTPDMGHASASASSTATLAYGGIGFFTNSTYTSFTDCHVIPHEQSLNKKLVGFYVCDHSVDFATRSIGSGDNYSGRIRFVGCHAGTIHSYIGKDEHGEDKTMWRQPREQFAEFLHQDVQASTTSACNFSRDVGHELDARTTLSGDQGVTTVYTNAALPSGPHYARLGQGIPHTCNYGGTSSNTHPYTVIEDLFCKVQKSGDVIASYTVPTATALYGNDVMTTCIFDGGELYLAFYVPSRARWYKYDGTEIPDNRPGAKAWFTTDGVEIKPANS